MIAQFTGAVMRAGFVAMMIATPSLLLPDVSPEVAQTVALIGLFGAAFVFFEYNTTYPGLIEFRDAPPFNRVRFLMIFLTLFLMAVACRGVSNPSILTEFVTAIGLLLGHAIGFIGSPIWLIMELLPEGTTARQASMVRTCAGLAYLIALVSLTVFAILIRFRSWPSPSGSFNVWINLPTFEPTAGIDVVKRLKRDARFNVLLGLVLPYLTPVLCALIVRNYDVAMFAEPQLLIWAVALWAFLPASLFMRGIAMRRLADMIAAKRRRLTAELAPADLAQLA